MEPQLTCNRFAQNIQRLLDCDGISMVCSMNREHCQHFIVKNDNCDVEECSHRNSDKNTTSSTSISIRKYFQSVIESQYYYAIQLWNLLDDVTSSNNSGERLIDHEPTIFLDYNLNTSIYYYRRQGS